MSISKLPVIQRDPHWCLSNLATALDCLADLCSSEEVGCADEQMNLLKRSELAGLFAVLKDYAEAIRLVLPEEIGRAI
jgi:hypothetical protein